MFRGILLWLRLQSFWLLLVLSSDMSCYCMDPLQKFLSIGCKSLFPLFWLSLCRLFHCLLSLLCTCLSCWYPRWKSWHKVDSYFITPLIINCFLFYQQQEQTWNHFPFHFWLSHSSDCPPHSILLWLLFCVPPFDFDCCPLVAKSCLFHWHHFVSYTHQTHFFCCFKFLLAKWVFHLCLLGNSAVMYKFGLKLQPN